MQNPQTEKPKATCPSSTTSAYASQIC